MNKMFVSALICLTILSLPFYIFAQKNAASDSTYLAIQAIKTDSVRIKKTNEYAYGLVIAKKPLANEITDLAIKNACSPYLTGADSY